MKKIDQNNHLQIESLLNECKGNLFEFLVAQWLSKRLKREDFFLLNLPRDFRGRLQFYEETIRKNDPDLLRNLPILAESVGIEISNHALFTGKTDLSFMVIGKMVATNDNELWNETDIVAIEGEGAEAKKYFLSLKLTKDHSYTNTKSAGIKSFIEKYFSSFGSLAKKLQNELNQEVDESFQMMGHKLYESADMEFKGSFGAEWSDHYTELPGELSAAMKEIVHQNYFRVALKLHDFLGKLYKESPSKFYQCLHALCGFGNPDIIQVHCFHQNARLKAVEIKTHEDFFTGQADEITIRALKENVGSFDIAFQNFTLQLRVKPMNKFTTAAYKINCSIKINEKQNASEDLHE
jgi:hypothetical protein